MTNSRLQRRLNQVWRRRTCTACHNTFTTHETVDLGGAIVIRYSAKDLRPLNRDILFISLYEACKHRPDAIRDAAALSQTVVSLLRQQLLDGAIERHTVVTTVTTVLQNFDKTAGAVYQAYHL